MWSELLVELVRDIVDRDPVFWEFPHLSEASAGEQAGALKSAVSGLIERLARDDPDQRIRQLAESGRRTEGVAPRGRVFRETADIDRTDAATMMRRGPARVSFGETAEGRTALDVTMTGGEARINGKITRSDRSLTVRVPAEVADRLRRMDPAGTVRAGEFFPGVTPERSVEAARNLARIGVLAVLEGSAPLRPSGSERAWAG